MAIRRVTIQDVADACGLSRNTVSKVFNGRGTVMEPTRQMVLKKAQELGYFVLARENAVQSEIHAQSIVLLTRHMPANYHFGTIFIPAFAAQLSRAGYTLMMYEISEEELTHGILPAHISLEQTAAILAIELFDREYTKKLCDLGLPVLLVDGYCGAVTNMLSYDLISMENLPGVRALVNHVISKGARKLGFIGDPKHCESFHERWIGFYTALTDLDITPNKELCILDADESPYGDPRWLAEKIRQMPQMPDAFICVNDYIAIHVMAALKQMGLSIPGQIMVAGFDGSAQSAVVEPSLTTIQIPGKEIGRIAADILLNRISNPSRSPISVYVKTTPLWRESTNRKTKV